MGNAQATESSTQVAHDTESCFERCTEMFSSFNEVALKQIIGAYAVLEEQAAKRFNRFRRVIDPFEQNGLIAEWKACVCEQF